MVFRLSKQSLTRIVYKLGTSDCKSVFIYTWNCESLQIKLCFDELIFLFKILDFGSFIYLKLKFHHIIYKKKKIEVSVESMVEPKKKKIKNY